MIIANIVIILFGHMYLTYMLLDACYKQYDQEFVKKFRILLWIPILNYIFVFTKEGLIWGKTFISYLKNQ